MDIEDPNETVKIKETEVPEKPKKSLGTELPEVENPMDIDEPADLGEAGKTWVRYQSDHARHSCRGPPCKECQFLCLLIPLG